MAISTFGMELDGRLLNMQTNEELWAIRLLMTKRKSYISPYLNPKCKDCGISLPLQLLGTPRKYCDECLLIRTKKSAAKTREKIRGGPPTKPYRDYTNEEVELMKSLWPILTTMKIAHILKRHVSSVGDKARKLGLKRPLHFEKYYPQKLPIGSLRRGGHGVWMRKISEGNGKADWQYEHRLIWERERGPIKHREMICFKDSNIDNLTIENLENMSREDFMRKYCIHRLYPRELLEVIHLNAWVKRKIKQRVENEQ